LPGDDGAERVDGHRERQGGIAAQIKWTWVGGSIYLYQQGTYGTMRIALPSTIPGARTSAASWADSNGNVWLFAGIGMDTAGISASSTISGNLVLVNGRGSADRILPLRTVTTVIQGKAGVKQHSGARLMHFRSTRQEIFGFIGGIGFDSIGTRMC